VKVGADVIGRGDDDYDPVRGQLVDPVLRLILGEQAL
jgi:hypothetical protein